MVKKDRGEGSIVVRENKNDLMEEMFRGLRTNLLFMLGKDERVILFSSTQPGEGKSFVAGNLAVSLAYLGKRVVVVGMDIRKPGLNKVFNISRKMEGITNYLSDPDHVELFDMVQRSDISPNLDILPGGPIPPNPTELVAVTCWRRLSPVEGTLRLCHLGYGPYRHGYGHGDHRPCGRHVRVRLPCGRDTEGRFQLHQRVAA